MPGPGCAENRIGCLDHWFKLVPGPPIELLVCSSPQLAVSVGREIPDGLVCLWLSKIDPQHLAILQAIQSMMENAKPETAIGGCHRSINIPVRDGRYLGELTSATLED